MSVLPLTVLKNRDVFWDRLRAGDLRAAELVSLLAFVMCVCALYGAVLAGWRSPLLSLYVAVKLPLLFLGTMAIVAVFNWMTAAAFGAGLTFRATLSLVLAAMAIACWILLGLVPVSLFFLFSGVPGGGTHDEVRYAHNGILMTHIVVLALAGAGGNVALVKGLRRVVRPACPAGALVAVWLAGFAFVGCQLSWILRPFVGSPFFPIAFLRPDCLNRNFYEFVFTEVLPFLVAGKR